MVKLGRDSVVAQLAAFGLRHRSLTLTTEGDYQPSDVDWNIKDIQHLNPVHSWKDHVTAIVEEDLQSQIDLHTIFGIQLPVVLVHYDAEEGKQAHYFSMLAWIVVTEKQFVVLSPTRTREETTYTVLASRYLRWTFPFICWVLRRNFAQLMSEDVPMRERRGQLRSWGYSFKGDERPVRDFRASLNIQRENVIRPDVDEPIDHTVALGEITDDGWAFVGRSDHRGLQLRRDDGRVVAFPRMCPHEGALLDGRELLDGCITCPWHGRRIAPSASVEVTGGTATTDVHELDVRDGSIHVTACRAAAP